MPAAAGGRPRQVRAAHPRQGAPHQVAPASQRGTARPGSAHAGSPYATAPHTGTRQIASPRVSGSYQGASRPPQRRKSGLPAAFALLAGLAVVLGAGALWWFVIRTVPVTVNAQELNVHEGVSVEQLLEDNDAFGVTAGNLVSVGGNVITEGGGARATVSVNGEEVAADQFAQRGLMSGDELEVSDGTEPNAFVTREQLVTMLWRYAGEPDSDYSLSAFTDAASVSEWAETAMSWAVENGLITGVTANTLVPSGSATRAQCAAILMRYVENI